MTGEDAVEIVETTPGIDLILMDINLGSGIDGTEAAEIILRKHDLPLIFLSSHTEREVVEKTEEITSYGYIVKTSGETVLIASIKMAFRLRESHQKELENIAFRKRLFECSLVPILVMDGETLLLIDCNPAAVFAYGFASRESTIGKTVLDVSAPVQYDGTDSSIKAAQYIDAAIADGQAVFEWRHQRPDGAIWDAEVHLISFHSNGRAFLQFSLHDITARRQIEEDLRTHQIELKMQNDELRLKHDEVEALRTRYFDLFELMPVSYFTISEQGMILEANLGAATELGVARGALVRMPFFKFIVQEDQDSFYLFRKRISETDGSQSVELRMQRADGTMFPACLKAVASSDSDGAVVFHILVMTRAI
jgi:PAS domain S-box-containing protein